MTEAYKPYGLSKSKVMSSRQCLKRLYLEIHRPDLLDEWAAPERLFKIGHEVGEVAWTLFPGGHLVDWDQGLAAAAAETTQLLSDGQYASLFEATFQHDGVLIRADVFTGQNGLYDLIEVKASTSVKDHYYEDCAIQTWVVEQAGYPVRTINLAHINNTFVYPGGNNYHGLFTLAETTEDVKELAKEVPSWVKAARDALNGPEPAIDCGDQCSKPYECPFIDYCNPNTTEYSVWCLPRGRTVAAELEAEGIIDIRDIPPGRLSSDKHEMVREVTITGKPYVDPQFGQILKTQSFPRYFLDFETVSFAVPIWIGTRPYQQLPFQWSCHIEESPHQLKHSEFLDTSGEPPMRRFAESLVEVLGKSGPVLVYSHFEKRILNDLILMFPDMSNDLEGLIDRLVDLLPLTRAYYYHPDMKGSWSIKAVLPTVAPDLNYEQLDEVQDGVMAGEAYLEALAPETDPDRREYLRNCLLKYCATDTLAMVRLCRFFTDR